MAVAIGRDESVIRLTLAENAYSFLNESMRNARRAKEGDDIQWTFAIVHVVQSLELLLKERLRREHEGLVFMNVAKPGTNTVGLDGALGRLEARGVLLDPSDRQRLQNAKKLRNSVVHYEISATREQLEAAYLDVFEFAHVFHLRELKEELHIYLDPDLWELEASLIEEFRASRIVYQGDNVIKSIPSKIISAQEHGHYMVGGPGGRLVERIPYGGEIGFDGVRYPANCFSCGVLVGQLHIVYECMQEQCAACGYQIYGCACEGFPIAVALPFPLSFVEAVAASSRGPGRDHT
ncbi:hypothetical protein ABT346_28360 [Micromonospora peucetia]|uniref:hypothetical protein n=1 Tax=Micromonospora peucetia TaxID=47871 RepID=UPI0033280555